MHFWAFSVLFGLSIIRTGSGPVKSGLAGLYCTNSHCEQWVGSAGASEWHSPVHSACGCQWTSHREEEYVKLYSLYRIEFNYKPQSQDNALFWSYILFVSCDFRAFRPCQFLLRVSFEESLWTNHNTGNHSGKRGNAVRHCYLLPSQGQFMLKLCLLDLLFLWSELVKNFLLLSIFWQVSKS